MINKVTLVGRVGQVYKIEEKVSSFSLATNENFRQDGEWKTETSWHKIVCFGDMAQKVSTLNIGDVLFVEGKITYSVIDSKNGDKKYFTNILSRYFRKLGSVETEEQEHAVEKEVTKKEAIETDLPF